MTNTGNTAKRISELKPPCPIIAAAADLNVIKSLQIHFGVLPVLATGETLDEITNAIKQNLSNQLQLKSGDKIIITGGYPFGQIKYTNFMQVEEIK